MAPLARHRVAALKQAAKNALRGSIKNSMATGIMAWQKLGRKQQHPAITWHGDAVVRLDGPEVIRRQKIAASGAK